LTTLSSKETSDIVAVAPADSKVKSDFVSSLNSFIIIRSENQRKERQNQRKKHLFHE
jgi:hypothetical protein